MQNDTSPSSGIDFFDVDHTIVNVSTSLQFLLTGIHLGYFPIKVLFSIPCFLWQYNTGKMDIRKVRKSISGFEGIEKEKLNQLSLINFEKNIKRNIFSECEMLIRSLSSKGRKIGFVTSSFTHVIQPLVQYLKVDYVLANSMKYSDGLTNGEFQGPFLFGDEKKSQTLALLKKLGISAKDCSFYTDSINDLSLLEEVGKPIAVNPDMKLKRLAHKRNWQIIYFRH